MASELYRFGGGTQVVVDVLSTAGLSPCSLPMPLLGKRVDWLKTEVGSALLPAKDRLHQHLTGFRMCRIPVSRAGVQKQS